MHLKTIVCAVFFSICADGADTPASMKPGSYRVGTDFRYFSSKANYKSGGGTSKELANGSSFMHIHNGYFGEYAVSRPLRVRGGLDLGFTRSEDGTTTRDNSGLKDIQLGAQYDVLSSRRFALTPDAEFVYPIFRVESGTDDSLIGEGAMELQGGTWAIAKFSSINLVSFLGMRYRDEGRSFILPYRLGAQYRSSSFSWLGELRGFRTFTDDSKSNNRSERESVTTRVNGGSLYFYSVNPELMELATQAGFGFGEWQVVAELAWSINGASYADGWTLGGGLRYQPGSTQSARATRRVRSEEFRIEDEEKYDDELFQKSSPAIKKKKPVRRVRTRRPVQKKAKSVDQLLKETESELEEQH